MENKIILKGNRSITNDNDIYLNPYTLNFIESTENEYISRPYVVDNKLNFITKDRNKKIDLDSNIYFNPLLLLEFSNIFKIYDIYVFDDINSKFIFLLETYTYKTVNRIIESLIRENFNDLKNNNKILSKLFYNIFNYEYKNINENDITDFINNWFKTKTNNSFYLNLGNDLEKFLSNKYD